MTIDIVLRIAFRVQLDCNAIFDTPGYVQGVQLCRRTSLPKTDVHFRESEHAEQHYYSLKSPLDCVRIGCRLFEAPVIIGFLL